jgi:YegS C-terminal NAD kinase beta sandwich-like domain
VSLVPGQTWGAPEHGKPDLVVKGGDGDLADSLKGTPPGVLVSFVPSPESDIARAIGLRAGATPQGLALPMDVLELADGTLAVNAVVLGTPPDQLNWKHRSGDIKMRLDGHGIGLAIKRATTVVVANGQFLRGLDVVPRGHPGDGRADVQLYRIGRRERKGMRIRLPTGSHLPHQSIVCRSAGYVDVTSKRALDLEIDGRAAGTATTLRATLVPARYRLLI